MTNFNCEQCGTAIIDSPTGYVTECEHFPLDTKQVAQGEIDAKIQMIGEELVEGEDCPICEKPLFINPKAEYPYCKAYHTRQQQLEQIITSNYAKLAAVTAERDELLRKVAIAEAYLIEIISDEVPATSRALKALAIKALNKMQKAAEDEALGENNEK